MGTEVISPLGHTVVGLLLPLRDDSNLYDCILGRMDGMVFLTIVPFSPVFSIIYQINRIPIPVLIVFFFFSHPSNLKG